MSPAQRALAADQRVHDSGTREGVSAGSEGGSEGGREIGNEGWREGDSEGWGEGWCEGVLGTSCGALAVSYVVPKGFVRGSHGAP